MSSVSHTGQAWKEKGYLKVNGGQVANLPVQGNALYGHVREVTKVHAGLHEDHVLVLGSEHLHQLLTEGLEER